MIGSVSAALGLGREKTSTNSATTTTSKANTRGTTSLTAMTDEQRGQLDTLLGALMGTTSSSVYGDPNPDYTKAMAISDAQGAVSSVFDTFSKTVLPTIFSNMNKAGAYNSTTSQLMANDAFAAANTKAAGLVLDNIAKYATITQQGQELGNQTRQMDLNALLSAFGIARDSTQTEKLDQTTDTTSTSNTRGNSKSTSMGYSMGVTLPIG